MKLLLRVLAEEVCLYSGDISVFGQPIRDQAAFPLLQKGSSFLLLRNFCRTFFSWLLFLFLFYESYSPLFDVVVCPLTGVEPYPFASTVLCPW